MIGKSIRLVAAGVAAGYISALFIHSDGMTKPFVRDESARVSVGRQLKPERDARPHGLLENSSRRTEIATAAAAPSAPSFRTPEEMSRALGESAKKNYAKALEEENTQLMAAGFSMDRIQWLRDRSEQLEAERRKAETDRRWKGLPPNVDLDYLGDNYDLDLRNEIGVEEYERYRKALGRQISVPVATILPGSIAESAGLKPGDRIISYSGQRTYSMTQITKISDRAVRPDSRITVEVERDGVRMLFEGPAGSLGITSPFPMPNRSKIFKLASSDAPL